MITLFSGTPGSGKSLHVAQKIYNWLRSGKYYVIANFEINRELVNHPEMFFYIPNHELTPDLLMGFSADYFQDRKFKESQLLLIIDEAQLMFNVREWNMKGRESWIHFFTQHRKFGYDVIIVAQFDRMIDKQLRSLFEYEIIHRKVSNFGWRGKMFSIWTGNKLFFAVKRWYPLHETVGSERFLYTRKLGDLYNTTLIFEKPSCNPASAVPELPQGSLQTVQRAEARLQGDVEARQQDFKKEKKKIKVGLFERLKHNFSDDYLEEEMVDEDSFRFSALDESKHEQVDDDSIDMEIINF